MKHIGMISTRCLGTLAALMLGFGAQAADLGGNCCADLEERVAELEASTARKGTRKVSLTVSGHVNQAFLWHDLDDIVDGDDRTNIQKYQIIDNENSQSRFRFIGQAAINADWSAGFLMEFGTAALQNGGGNISLRHNVVWLNSKQLGKFWLGRTSEATDGIIEISLSKAGVASTMGSLAPFDSFLSRQDLDPSGDVLNATIVNPFDGSRKDLVKYQTPTLAGFQASAAWSDDDSWDVALRYAGEFGGIRVATGIGYRDETESEDRRFWGGSASVMHTPSGLFLDGAYGESDGTQVIELAASDSLGNAIDPPFPFDGDIEEDAKLTFWGLRGGIENKWNALGKTTLFGEYQMVDGDFDDAELKLWGLGIVQQVDAAAMELYLSFRNIEVSAADLSEDVNVVVGGAKLRF